MILQTVISISSMVIQNCLFNNVCKNKLKTDSSIYRFNMIIYAMCICLFGVIAIRGKISLYTVISGLIFGVVTALSNFYKMKALKSGPMHITLLITTSSMIIPTISGVFFGEHFSGTKFVMVLLLIGFIYLSLDRGKNSKINTGYLLFCLLAFVFQGSIGVLQKIHQNSPYKAETGSFLFFAFICSLIYSWIRSGKNTAHTKFTKGQIALAAICGICTYTMNFLNLKLSGLLPSQLFFPLVNGSAIVISSLLSVVIFKEKLSKKQFAGLLGGILSLIGICIV